MMLLAAQRVSRSLFLACLSTALVACGNSGSDTPITATTVESTDGASVRYTPTGAAAQRAITVSVARNGSGAPPLPEDTTPIGAVYQFAPLGLAAAGIEIRVPFDKASAAQPHLLVALPGEAWFEVADAHVEGNTLVANVAQLGHAVVVSHTDNPADARSLRASASAQAAGSTQPLALSVDPTTTPALPAPDLQGIVRLHQST